MPTVALPTIIGFLIRQYRNFAKTSEPAISIVCSIIKSYFASAPTDRKTKNGSLTNWVTTAQKPRTSITLHDQRSRWLIV